MNKWLEQNRDKKREWDRAYQRKRRALNKGLKAKEFRVYKEKYPEKVKAQQILNREIRKGIITRSPVCERCGIQTKTHAHHNDYNKALEVIFVCAVCHKKEHGTKTR